MGVRDKLLSGTALTAEPVDEVVALVPPPADAPKKKPISVMLSIPSGRTWEARSATAICGMAMYSALHGVQVNISNLEGSMITKQRNDLVETALKWKQDYILFIDCDLVFPPDSLLKLLKHDKDIVGATYNKRVPPYETLGKLAGDRPPDISKGGLHAAELMPGGFMLVRTSVYEKLPWPWYYETYKWPGETGVEAFKSMMRDSFCSIADEAALSSVEGTPFADWINRIWEVEKANPHPYWSEDLNFCRKALKSGLGISCDLDVTFNMVHLGTHEVTCKKPEADSVIVPAVM